MSSELCYFILRNHNMDKNKEEEEEGRMKEYRKRRQGPRYKTVMAELMRTVTAWNRPQRRSKSCDRNEAKPEQVRPPSELSRRHSEIAVKETLPNPEVEKEKRDGFYRKAQTKMQEFLETEEKFVQNDLELIINGYYSAVEEAKSNKNSFIPEDLARGKDRILFANIRDIYEFHKRIFLPELRLAINDPSKIKKLFEARKDSLKYKYGRYCINKPKSEHIITQHKKYFQTLWKDLGLSRCLSDLMTTPVRRIQIYSLLLKDLSKLYAKSCRMDDKKEIEDALEIATEVANYVNDMMTAGRIDGFEGDVTRHGLLLKRGTIECHQRTNSSISTKSMKFKKCQIFVFQESVIVCHDSEKPMDSMTFPVLTYWCHYQMNKLNCRELEEENMFELQTESEIIEGVNENSYNDNDDDDDDDDDDVMVFRCADKNTRNQWIKEICDQTKYLNSFADALSNPIS